MENTYGVHKEGLIESPKHVGLFAKDNGMTIGSAHMFGTTNHKISLIIT